MPDPKAPARTPTNGRATYVGATAVALAALSLYLLTAARDIVAGDTPEFVTVALTLGVAHPPGYPVLTLLGYAFGGLPIGSEPFRVTLVSALSHAAAAGLVFLTAVRLTRSLPAALLAAGALATEPLFWRWSLVAETFPLSDLFAALLAYLLVRWHDEPERAAPFVAAAFVAGLGLANQQTIVLLAPAAAYVLWRRRKQLEARPELLVWSTVALAVGLSPYAYLLFAGPRHAFLDWGDVGSVADAARHVLRLEYGSGKLLSEAGLRGGTALERVVALFGSFSPLLGILAVLGTIGAYRSARWYLWTALLAFGASGIAFAAYVDANPNVPTSRFVLERFYLLPQVAITPLAAFGALLVVERARRLRPELRLAATPVVLAAAALFVAAQVGLAYAAVDQSGNHVARRFGEDILATLEPDSVFLASPDHVVLPVAYLQAVEGMRPDVTLVMIPLLQADWYVRELRQRDPKLVLPDRSFTGPDTLKRIVEANAGRPIALGGEEPGMTLGAGYGTVPNGLVLRVVPTASRIELASLAADNDRLLKSYRVPGLADVKTDSFDRFIVTWYALPSYRMGKQFEANKAYADARGWYVRALAVDPDLAEARDALARLPR